MKPKELLEILSVAEKLKCNTRHCYTSSGRRESVAEHSWRAALMAYFPRPLQDRFGNPASVTTEKQRGGGAGGGGGGHG